MDVRDSLQEFFAVTRSADSESVYYVSADPAEGEKIAIRGHSVIKLGAKLSGEQMIAIDGHLCFYYLEDRCERTSDSDSTASRELKCRTTSQIVGLFLRQDTALACFNSVNLQAADPRWAQYTAGTLAAIGKHHPRFYLRDCKTLKSLELAGVA